MAWSPGHLCWNRPCLHIGVSARLLSLLARLYICYWRTQQQWLPGRLHFAHDINTHLHSHFFLGGKNANKILAVNNLFSSWEQRLEDLWRFAIITCVGCALEAWQFNYSSFSQQHLSIDSLSHELLLICIYKACRCASVCHPRSLAL